MAPIDNLDLPTGPISHSYLLCGSRVFGHYAVVVKAPVNTSGRDTKSSISNSLLLGLRRRDTSAWHQLVELYLPVVYQWCRNRGLQADDAEDVCQEVFITVEKKIAEFDRDDSNQASQADQGNKQAKHTFRGWLWTITYYKIGDFIRRYKREIPARGGTDARELIEQTPEYDEDLSIRSGVIGGLCRRAIDMVQQEFKTSTWQAFWRTTVEGRTVADTAQGLGMSRNAVYVARSKVLKRLREVLGDEER